MTLHVAISGWLLGNGPSGANRRLWTLLQALPPLLGPGERVTVLQAPGVTLPALPGVHFLPVAIPARPTWRRVLAERQLLPRTLREHRVTVLDHAFLPVPVAPCPVVLTVHDVRDADGFGRRPRWLGRLALRHAVRRVHSIVAPSDFTAARIRALAPAAPRIHVVRNAVAPLPSPPEDRPQEPPFLLHVGHLEPRKNVELLIRALACLPATNRPKLRLAGADAGSGRSLRRLARTLGVADAVEFAGAVADGTLAGWYASAAAVCVPSRYEGFGLPAVEALAVGAPTLVADAGALPEVVGSAGVVLPVDEPMAWARTWSALLARPRAAAPVVAVACTATAMAAAMLGVWRAAAADGPGRGA